MRALKISILFLTCFAGALANAPVRAAPDDEKSIEAQIERMCSRRGNSDEFDASEAAKADRIAARLLLTDAQKALYKEVQNVRAKVQADAIADFCANKLNLSTFEKTLAFRDARSQLVADTMKAAKPKVMAFYNSLDDKQKSEFQDMLRRRTLRDKQMGLNFDLNGYLGSEE